MDVMTTQTICDREGHEYKPLGRKYAKPYQNGSINGITGGPNYDHTKYYVKLYCPKCGDVKEVDAT